MSEFNEAGRLSAAYMARRVQRSARHSAAVRLAISDRKLVTRLGTAAVGWRNSGSTARLGGDAQAEAWMKVNKGLGKLGVGAFEFVPEQ